LSYRRRPDFEVTDEIRKLGFSRIYVMGKTLFLEITGNSVIPSPFYKDDIHKTVKGIEKSLKGLFDEQDITKLCTLFTQVWLASVEAEVEKAKIAQAQERNQREKIRDQIKQMKAENAAITCDKWISELRHKYQNLREVVNRNFPELWPGLEFELSVRNANTNTNLRVTVINP
jgi:hypothetical protein